jgi:hypothetical protein
MVRHRKDVRPSASQKRPGQRRFLGSLCSLRAPRASNERHGGQSVLLRAEQTATTRSLPRIRFARSRPQSSLHGPHHFSSRHNGFTSSSPQPSASLSRGFSAGDAEDLALYREKFRRRLPESQMRLRARETRASFRSRRPSQRTAGGAGGADTVLSPGPLAVPQLEGGGRLARRVDGEAGQSHAVGVGEAQLGAGMRPFLPHDQPHPLGPALETVIIPQSAPPPGRGRAA